MSTQMLSTPEVTLPLALEHGLTEQEYGWIVDTLGRTPTFVELGIYSVMWSEHCSYKNSIVELKKLPREGGRMLVGAGEENAGLIDIGEGLGVAFKIESHNHPSAVEPYQGAATGVGGIQRDIFTMGARPICSLNSLRFGSLEQARVRYLLDGVVRGIGDYGNSFGVPTVAGEVYFDPSYEGNPLVNAMSVGIVKVGETVSAIATGTDNPVFIVGSATGRDGIHGATFASEEISEATDLGVSKIEKMRTYLLDGSLSLDKPMNDEDGRSLGDVLVDPNVMGDEIIDRLTYATETSLLRDLLEDLRPIEADILRHRFGLDDDQEYTLKEIGVRYNLSRERIRQLQEQALDKMRRALQTRSAV